MVYKPILAYASIDLLQQILCSCRKLRVLQHLSGNFAYIPQDNDGEHISRNQIAIFAGIIARTKAGPSHSRIGGHAALTFTDQGIGGWTIRSLKCISGVTFMMLFRGPQPDDPPDSLYKSIIELSNPPGVLPQQIAELDRITQGVNFVFPLPNPRVHVRKVLLVPLAVRLLVKGVRVRI
ncbi:hypothetical protein D3C74_371030 [compost metagenome]